LNHRQRRVHYQIPASATEGFPATVDSAPPTRRGPAAEDGFTLSVRDAFLEDMGPGIH